MKGDLIMSGIIGCIILAVAIIAYAFINNIFMNKRMESNWETIANIAEAITDNLIELIDDFENEKKDEE
jgi:hypothetical protein